MRRRRPVLTVQCLEPRALPAGPSPEALASAAAAIAFQSERMDRDHGTYGVYEDVSSAGNHGHAWAKIQEPGEDPDATMDGSDTSDPFGATSIKATFTPRPGAQQGGFYLQVGTLTGDQTSPQANWGTVPAAGVDLRGAVRLAFRARGQVGGERVEFFMGGVGRHGDTGQPVPGFPYPDSTPRTPGVGSAVTLTPDWRDYTIDLAGRDLSYVLGLFGWYATAAENPAGVTFYLDDIRYELAPAARAARLAEPHFVTSYETRPVQGLPPPVGDFDFRFRNAAFTYDQAVTALAYLADGSPDALRRARQVGDALVYALHNDRTFRAPGERVLRSIYAAGDLALPPGWTPGGHPGTVPAPGFYLDANKTFVDLWSQADDLSAIDTGNNAWGILALSALYMRTGEAAYLDAAAEIGRYLRRFKSTDPADLYQGFRGGINRAELPDRQVRPWAATEHNIDLVAAYGRLAMLDPAGGWEADADHARRFVEAMWDPVQKYYLTGTGGLNVLNRDVLPLDIQPWAVLADPTTFARHPEVLDAAEAHHRTTADGVTGYDFNADRDGVWFEGTGQMAVAYARTPQADRAEPIRAELRRAQGTTQFGPGGIAAASHDGGSTGFTTPDGTPISYFRRRHIGATGWLVFAQLEFNPFLDTAPATSPAVSIAGATATERTGVPTAVTLTLTLAPASDVLVTVRYGTVSGTALAGRDFVPAAGRVVFRPGETTKTVTVLVRGDGTDEDVETFRVRLTSVVGAGVGSAAAAVTIQDDDAPPRLVAPAVAVAERAAGPAGSVTVRVPVRLSAASGKVIDLTFATADGTAGAPADYVGATGTVRLLPGQTSGVAEVTVRGDVLDEGAEVFSVAFIGDPAVVAAGATAAVRIGDDDPLPRVTIEDAAVGEGDGGPVTASVAVRLSGPSGRPVSVPWATAGGTARPGADFPAQAGTVTFAPGEVLAGVAVDVHGDTLDEPDESLTVALGAPVNALLARGRARVTVLDDDPPPTLGVADAGLPEGDGGARFVSFTARLSEPSGRPVTVRYATADGSARAGRDYEAARGVLTFAPGETAKVVRVRVFGDMLPEGNEEFFLFLSLPVNAALDRSVATGTITDDD